MPGRCYACGAEMRYRYGVCGACHAAGYVPVPGTMRAVLRNSTVWAPLSSYSPFNASEPPFHFDGERVKGPGVDVPCPPGLLPRSVGGLSDRKGGLEVLPAGEGVVLKQYGGHIAVYMTSRGEAARCHVDDAPPNPLSLFYTSLEMAAKRDTFVAHNYRYVTDKDGKASYVSECFVVDWSTMDVLGTVRPPVDDHAYFHNFKFNTGFEDLYIVVDRCRNGVRKGVVYRIDPAALEIEEL